MDRVEVQILTSQTRTFIFKLEDNTLSKVFRSFDLLETFGYRLGMPHVKQIDRGLFELRIRGKQDVRLFFTFRDHKAIVLHGFVKKTMQIPNNELRMAQARMRILDEI